MALSVHEVMLCDTDIKPDELSGSNFLSLDKKKREILIRVLEFLQFLSPCKLATSSGKPMDWIP